MHSRGFLHRDIKPDNFLMGLGRKANQVTFFTVYIVLLSLCSLSPCFTVNAYTHWTIVRKHLCNKE